MRAAFIALTVLLTPKLLELRDAEVRERVKDQLKSLGVPGIGVMFCVQVLQIVVALLPGEPVELLMGFLYGTFGGLALCLAGIAAGTAAVFLVSKKIGEKYIVKFGNPEKFRKLAFLRDPVRRDSLFFLLLMIPGTPKDMLTYFAPLTKISPIRFIVISCAARIPSVISSTYVGANAVGR